MHHYRECAQPILSPDIIAISPVSHDGHRRHRTTNKTMAHKIPWSTGSNWLRIDPHLHTPGTLRNSQFGDYRDAATWSAYENQLRLADPAPAILGITDYFVPRGYKFFRQHIEVKSIPGLRLVFANIELRLNIKTDRGKAFNTHLLVSPDDPDHVATIESKLHSLHFHYGGQQFGCTEDDIRRLGRAHAKDDKIDDETALYQGARQFLVEFGELRELKDDAWIADNVPIAVAAGGDGLGGIATDSSFHAQREELAAVSDIIFSANPADRQFWSGNHSDFAARGYVCKPCLNGSDAHRLEDVLRPSENRICWIRSEPTFEGLRQILVEPVRRVHIGSDSPGAPPQGRVIRTVRFQGAPWVSPGEVTLNPGLVSVIGARGSGKTALADMIALAADATDPVPSPASFLDRARQHLSDLQVQVEWADGTITARRLDEAAPDSEPLVKYLSQHFVERISAVQPAPTQAAWDAGTEEPPSDELLNEIERVVFDAIPTEDRLMCASFRELREDSLAQYIAELSAHKEKIRSTTLEVAKEQQLFRDAPYSPLTGEGGSPQSLITRSDPEGTSVAG